MGKFGWPLTNTKPNTNQNTTRNSSGFSMAHAAPRAEEVYLTFTSLRVRLARISRNCHSSYRRRIGWSLWLSDVVTCAVSSPARPCWRRRSAIAIDELLERDLQRRERGHPGLLGEQRRERREGRPGGGQAERARLLPVDRHRQPGGEPDPGQHVEPRRGLGPGQVVRAEPLGQQQGQEPFAQVLHERR